MNINDIEWTAACCGESCKYAEVETASGWLQIKTSHDDDDLAYQVRRYGKDKMPIDAGYVSMTEAQLQDLLA